MKTKPNFIAPNIYTIQKVMTNIYNVSILSLIQFSLSSKHQNLMVSLY